MTRILVAYDHGPGARAALKRAVELFPDADVTLAECVVAPRDRTGTAVAPPMDELLASTDRELAALARSAGFRGRVSTRVSAGGPAQDMILSTAADVQPDVIVVGTHDRPAVARLLLGSVAVALVKRAACPVLVVRAPGGRA